MLGYGHQEPLRIFVITGFLSATDSQEGGVLALFVWYKLDRFGCNSVGPTPTDEVNKLPKSKQIIQ